jgi:hypothetical protein
VSLILDAGALIAYDRGSPEVQAILERAERQVVDVRTTTGVVAQAWRNGSTQAQLARLLKSVREEPFSEERARATGILLARSRTSDVIDAGLVEIMHDGDEVLTSDPEDIFHLAVAANKRIVITEVH